MKENNISMKKINLLVTNLCNLHCKMCDYKLIEISRKELQLDQIKKVICEALDLGLEELDLSGGEPMVRKDIYEIISFCSSLNIKTELVTNGTLIGQEEAKKLVDSGLNSVVISMEGFEEVNDLIRGKGSYKKALEGIYQLKKYRDKLDYIRVGVTVSKSNYDQLFDFTKFLIEEIGVDSITYNPFNEEMLCPENYEKVKEMFTISSSQLENLKGELEKIIEYQKERNLELSPEKYLRKIPDYFAGEKMLPKGPCYEPSRGCAIDCSGEVYSCWGVYVDVGDITKSSLKEIIASKEYKDMCINALNNACKGCLKSCYVAAYQ